MKKNFLLFILCLVCFSVILINGCRKDSSINTPPTHIGTATSFTEEFENLSNIETRGWIVKDLSSFGSAGGSAIWRQGSKGYDKGSGWSGFSAYSYTTLQDEFAYSCVSSTSNNYTVSSWLITPVLSVKNGDKISFYSRADTAGIFTDRMQVLMNNSSAGLIGNSNSAGGFTTVLFDINSAQAASGYPLNWTKYEYIFTGISGNIDTRIGFRHYVTNTKNAKGVGIDLFKFEVN